jgi:Mg-chelatase subunit ChlD
MSAEHGRAEHGRAEHGGAEHGNALERWRLILGRFAERSLPGALGTDGRLQRMDRVLDYLYGREYGARGIRPGADGESREGGREASALSVPEWIREVRELFPTEVCEVVTKHALTRYGLTELVTDAQTLERMEPSYELLKAVLTFRGLMQGRVLDVARELVRKVVDELRRKVEQEVRRTLVGQADRFRRTRQKRAKNLHLARTVRRSLKHYDPEARRLMAADLQFFARIKRHVQWDIIVCVDCSGSMMDSLIHSAVMAAIFHGLPSVRAKLVAFDTSVVDLSAHVDDPVEVLMSVLLGGGTDIGGALTYCARLVEQPSRTIVVLVTDFFEGGSPSTLLSVIKQLSGAGVRVWCLAALSQQAEPVYDHSVAAACVAAGAEVAALTPRRLAEWVAKVIG